MYLTPDRVDEPLYVITTVFNPVRFKSRYKLYQRFATYVRDSGAVLVTVEASFGERTPAVVETVVEGPADPALTRAPKGTPHLYIKVRTPHELWIKENLINIGIARLPADWKYVAWVDADVMFARPNWVGETIQQLQHYQFLQMFSYAQDLNHTYEPILKHRSFADCFQHGVQSSSRPGYYYAPDSGGAIHWHPGFAWAARREAIDAVGGLIDFGILGAGDNHMAHALIGRVEESVHADTHPEYRGRLFEWQARAERHIRRNVGGMKGLLLHYWHGAKRNRQYRSRWQILVKHQFQPSVDLKPDWQGVHQLSDLGEPRTIAMRDDIRAYFRSRDEDSTN